MGSRTSLMTLQADRIAIIKPSALGDIIHSLPVLHALRQRFPKAHLSWVVNRSYQPLLMNHPCLNETIPFDRGAIRRGLKTKLRTTWDFVHELRSRRFDLVIDMQGLLRSGLMTLATGARRRIGYSIAREGSRYCYTDRIPTPPLNQQHAVDRCWRVAEAFGVGDLPKQFHVPIPQTDRLWAERTLLAMPRPWIVMSAGARWLTKRWPPEHFAVLAKRSQKQFGGTIVFVGTSDESVLTEQIIPRLEGPYQNWVGQTSLTQLAALVSLADVMIANDTGPLHLAAALGRPVIAPYTCTSVRLHGPYGVERGAVESAVWCQGSYIKRCDRLDCMTELHPDRLWFFLHEVLSTWQRRCRSA